MQPDKQGLVLTGDQHHAVIEDLSKVFEKHMMLGPGMMAALYGNFLGRLQYYVTHGSEIPEADFLKMIEKNREMGYAGMTHDKPPEMH